MSDDEIRELLLEARTIAVVGCSPKPERDSHQVARYLQERGYQVIPVNPVAEEILGQKCYPSVAAIPSEVAVDIVDVFRRSEHVPPIVDEAVQRGAGAVWLQLGCANPEAERAAADAGLKVVSDRCIKVEHALRLG